MLTIIACLVAAAYGQSYPPATSYGVPDLPPAPPVAETLQPYPPSRQPENLRVVEGPYAPTIEVQRVQPVGVSITREQPVLAYAPKALPVVSYAPNAQITIGQVPRGPTVIGDIPRSQPVLLRKTPVQPYPQPSRYQHTPTPQIQLRPAALQVASPEVQHYKTVQPQRVTYPRTPVRPVVTPEAVRPLVQQTHPTPLGIGKVQDSPYPAAQPPRAQPYAEGGELSPGELEAPTPPQTRYGLPKSPSESGGEVSPEELELPPNTQVNLQDNRLQYSHGFSDDKGTKVREQGSLLSTNEGWEYVIAKKGSYSYVSPEGIPITVNYIADHNGYRVLPN